VGQWFGELLNGLLEEYLRFLVLNGSPLQTIEAVLISIDVYCLLSIPISSKPSPLNSGVSKDIPVVFQ
jgi:hypothetical protein